MSSSNFVNVNNTNNIDEIIEDNCFEILWLDPMGAIDYIMFEAAKHAALSAMPVFFPFNNDIFRIYPLFEVTKDNITGFRVFRNACLHEDWTLTLTERFSGIDWKSVKRLQNLT